MRLHSLVVEGFRGLRSARVTFEETTVLIGESDCGVPSLLDALAFALRPTDGDDGAPDASNDGRRAAPSAGASAARPARVALEFRERRAGEWDALAGSPLDPLLRTRTAEPRRLALEIRTGPAPGGDGDAAGWRLQSVDDERAGASLRDPEALDFVRRINPLVRLHAGAIGLPRTAPGGARRHASLTPETAALVERIERSHAALASGGATDLQAALDDGFDAARAFIASASRHLDDRPHVLREMVAEVLERGRAMPPDAATAAPRFDGRGGERLGVLALVAALLRELSGALPAGAEPLWVIEDPEAHLHPMTLAAVMTLIGRVRWQKILTTQSGDVLAAEPLRSLRRLTRADGAVREWRVGARSLSAEDLRRVGYHLRSRRGVASFARCWLLVEGETEFWVIPELARLAGHDFAREGVACVEFAQCGLRPLVRLARELGIEWHVLTDGDRAGKQYGEQARGFLGQDPEVDRLTRLREADIERCFYEHGYAALFRRLAGTDDPSVPARRVIERAIRRTSKPTVALELVRASSTRGADGVPRSLSRMIETCVRLARRAR